MLSSAEISVVETFGSPKRLNSSSVTSRMRSAVRRGFFGLRGHGGAVCGQSSIDAARSPPARSGRCLQSRARHASHLASSNVGKTYAAARGDVRALDDVSFDIEPGEFFGLLGPERRRQDDADQHPRRPGAREPRPASACSATTSSPTTRRRAAALGIVPQELVFDPFFSVRETLRIQSGYFGVRNNDAWIDELLANLGLADKADANMRQLSGGMKRRVLVAQALVHRPPVIVLDEPTAGVDVELRQTLWQFVARLNKEGHTVLLTTHYLEEAEALCGRIAMLKQGRVVALDRTSALLAGTASTMLRFKTRRRAAAGARRAVRA